MTFRCPDCNSNLFHVEMEGEKIKIQCYKTKKCGWEIQAKAINPDGA